MIRNSVHMPLALLCSALLSAPAASGFDLIGIHHDTGALYSVSTIDASVSLLGTTGVDGFGSLEMGPDGNLYGFTTGDAPIPTLYRIDPTSFSTTVIGPLGLGFVFEGSIVFAPDGTVYATNADGQENPQLFTIDINTGAASVVGTISGGLRDINAMAWRDDGMLVGVDRVTNSLLAIDPLDASASLIAALSPTLGAVGGMAVLGDTGYFVTGGPGGFLPGSNELYEVDLFTGAHSLVGSLSADIGGMGLAGLAVPEPATLVLLLAGGGMLLRRKK